ncbi:kinesin light chain-like protein [Metarhizium robertsii]|uniref:Kinesin light chain-like protein n=1 Tax=Metarhizium robertsii TaxID=568076 RepID=A0A0A1UN07_9HYPO|nr:kinesin light chain-like protein [Metarhizium robertsii]
MAASFPQHPKRVETPEPSLELSALLTRWRTSGIKVLHVPKDAVVDIVFVHGLEGDRETTWTAENAPGPWPQVLLPAKIPGARILTFGYDPRVANWPYVASLVQVAKNSGNLVSKLAEFRRKDNTHQRPIIFVCHDFGGLILEDGLFTSSCSSEESGRNIVYSTRGIIFLGTPHRGAGWTKLLLAEHTRKCPNDRDLNMLRQGPKILARIQDRFFSLRSRLLVKALTPIQISCFFETLSLPQVGLVVPQESATVPRCNSIAMRKNHMNMTKFAAPDDPDFEFLCTELGLLVAEIHAENFRRARDHENLGPYHFVGRSTILRQLKYRLRHGQPLTSSSSQPRVSLLGPAGIGKTQIALAYSYWLYKTYPGMSVFWVHARNATQFLQSFTSIAQRCHILTRNAYAMDAGWLVKDWLERESAGRWLMVIDGADEARLFSPSAAGSFSFDPSDQNLHPYIPVCAHGSVLITTRDRKLGSRLAEDVIVVPRLSLAESNELLRTKLGGLELASKNLSRLSNRLECLPLPLAQAAAYMRENHVGVSKYLDLLEEDETESVGRAALGEDPLTSSPALARLVASFERLRLNDFEDNLLSIMSCFNPQAIPMQFLLHYSQLYGLPYSQLYGQQDELELISELPLKKALETLRDFCLISLKEDKDVSLLPFVLRARQKWLSCQDMTRHYAEQALLILSDLFPYGNFENRATCSEYLPHVYSVLHLEGTGSEEESIAKATLLHRVAGFLCDEGRWREAEPHQQDAVNLRTSLLGEQHPLTLASMTNLASIFGNQGQWNKAESIEVHLTQTRRRLLGEDHPDTLASIANLALTYKSHGRWHEAEELERQVMKSRTRVLGEEHPDTLASMRNLASTLSNQGKWKEAEEFQVAEIAIIRRVLGAEHPRNYPSMANLASIYLHQGRLQMAEDLSEQVTNALAGSLGEDHPSTLTNTANLASIYRNQGRLREAESLLKKVAKTSHRVLGEGSPETLTIMSNLSSTYIDQGRWKEAEELALQVLDHRKRALGPKHPLTLTSMANLALIFKGQGRLQEAEDLEMQVAEISRTVLGKDHPDTLISMANLVSIYLDRGRVNEAEKLQTEGRFSEAEALEVEAMETRKQQLGPEHPLMLSSMANLSLTYYYQGRWKEAEALGKEVLEKKQMVLGPEHPSTLTTMNNLASIFSIQGQLGKAEKLEAEVLEMRKRVLGEEHPDTMASMNQLAITLNDQGRYEEAKALMMTVIQLLKRLHGPSHPYTTASQSTLDEWEANHQQEPVSSSSRTDLSATGPKLNVYTIASLNELCVHSHNSTTDPVLAERWSDSTSPPSPSKRTHPPQRGTDSVQRGGLQGPLARLWYQHLQVHSLLIG